MSIFGVGITGSQVWLSSGGVADADEVSSGIGAPPWKSEASSPTANVVTVPISTYQVQAMGVSKWMPTTMDSPAVTPAMAAPSRGLRVSTPSRKTPSSAPMGMDPMIKTTSSTDFEWRAAMAMVSNTPSPRHGCQARDSESGRIGDRSGACAIKIHYRGGGQRIQHRAQVGHGRGQDGGDDQPGRTGRQVVPDELGI